MVVRNTIVKNVHVQITHFITQQRVNGHNRVQISLSLVHRDLRPLSTRYCNITGTKPQKAIENHIAFELRQIAFFLSNDGGMDEGNDGCRDHRVCSLRRFLNENYLILQQTYNLGQ